MAAADRTSSVVWLESTDPSIIRGKVSAYNDDWFNIPYGKAVDCMVSSQDDDDAIVSADVSSGVKITFGAVDDGGAALATTRFDILFEVILTDQ